MSRLLHIVPGGLFAAQELAVRLASSNGLADMSKEVYPANTHCILVFDFIPEDDGTKVAQSFHDKFGIHVVYTRVLDPHSFDLCRSIPSNARDWSTEMILEPVLGIGAITNYTQVSSYSSMNILKKFPTQAAFEIALQIKTLKGALGEKGAVDLLSLLTTLGLDGKCLVEDPHLAASFTAAFSRSSPIFPVSDTNITQGGASPLYANHHTAASGQMHDSSTTGRVELVNYQQFNQDGLLQHNQKPVSNLINHTIALSKLTAKGPCCNITGCKKKDAFKMERFLIEHLQKHDILLAEAKLEAASYKGFFQWLKSRSDTPYPGIALDTDSSCPQSSVYAAGAHLVIDPVTMPVYSPPCHNTSAAGGLLMRPSSFEYSHPVSQDQYYPGTQKTHSSGASPTSPGHGSSIVQHDRGASSGPTQSDYSPTVDDDEHSTYARYYPQTEGCTQWSGIPSLGDDRQPSSSI